jgi:hypothetical protein
MEKKPETPKRIQVDERHIPFNIITVVGLVCALMAVFMVVTVEYSRALDTHRCADLGGQYVKIEGNYICISRPSVESINLDTGLHEMK